MQHRDDSTIYSGPSPQDLDCIPADLKTRSQWVLWRGADRIDQQTGEVTGLEKIPIDPQTLRNASTTDPKTWGKPGHNTLSAGGELSLPGFKRILRCPKIIT